MIRKILASLLILLFLVFSIPGIVLFGFYRTLLNRDFYEGPLLTESYNRTIPIVVDEFYSSDTEILVKYFEKNELIAMAKKDIPEDAFRNIVNNGFDQLENVLNGGGQSKIILDFSPLKSYINTFLADITDKLFTEKIPSCKSGEYPKMKSLPSCIPSGAKADAYKENFNKNLLNFTANINIKPIGISTTSIKENLYKIETIKTAGQAFFAVLGLLCLLVLLILWKPFARGFKWLGVTFLIDSFVALVLYKMVPFLRAYVQINSGQIPEKYLPDAQGLVNFVINYYQSQIFYIVIFIFVLGCIMILGGYLKSHRAK